MEATDKQTRIRFGLSRRGVAKLAGVDVKTVNLYEWDAAAVGARHPEKRDALRWVYDALRSLLANAPGRRG